MDELQNKLGRIGLNSLAGYGFALAGGYALQAHGLVDRMSEDVDLFTDRWDLDQFGRAVEAVVDAYQRHGLEVAVVRRADTFARMRVHDPEDGRLGEVDLAADYRGHEPDTLTIGPVLAEVRWSGDIDNVIVRRSTTSIVDRSKIAQHSCSPRRET